MEANQLSTTFGALLHIATRMMILSLSCIAIMAHAFVPVISLLYSFIFLSINDIRMLFATS